VSWVQVEANAVGYFHSALFKISIAL
jgi:hypothetical protein